MLNLHSYESLGTFDGPGIRLVVFLQGCNFRCAYCANPDTIDVLGGQLVDESEVVRMAISQKAFFGKRGGITFSGGEATLQAHSLIPLFVKLKEAGIHICLDTNGSVLTDEVKTLLSHTDLVLLDIKQMDSLKHIALIQRSNETTLQFAAYLESQHIPMWLRYVLIPTLTDGEEDLHAFGLHFKEYQTIRRVEILPYHTLGVHKYESLHIPYPLTAVPENSTAQLERAEGILSCYFKTVCVN